MVFGATFLIRKIPPIENKGQKFKMVFEDNVMSRKFKK